MPFDAPNAHNTFRRLAALLCLIVLLVIAVPCPAATPHTPSHCADCCAPIHSLSTPALCCTLIPQPSHTTAHHHAPRPPSEITLATIFPTPVPVQHPTRIARVLAAPPPRLHPNLRI